MNAGIWIALISLCGTLLGSLTGLLNAQRVVTLRLKNLEEKAASFEETEEKLAVLQEKVECMGNRVEELEENQLKGRAR